ncbi:translocator protein-like [Artemia franciscana]|uniref:translocator protein-like n=1 Tax=Artemia franciscana TaxID=6661 RepID=UPI0032DAA42E
MPFPVSAVAATLFPNVGGIFGALITRREVKTWYPTLNKPEWRPPNWAFGPVWTALYTGMGYASYLIYKEAGGFNGAAKLPLALYASQLALNWAWTPIFFGLHSIKGGLIDILLLDAAAAATAYSFFKVNSTAGWILAPYLAWLSVATALNYYVWKNNSDTDAAAVVKKGE